LTDPLLIFTIALIGVNLAAFPVFAFTLSKKPNTAVGILVFLILVGAFNAFYTVLTFGGAFGPGVLLLFSSFLAIPLSVVLLIVGWPFFYWAVGKNYLRHGLYLGGGLVIVALQFAPLVGNFGVGGYCDEHTRQIGNQIVTALENYRQTMENIQLNWEHCFQTICHSCPQVNALGIWDLKLPLLFANARAMA
jgi:hypothetical protein